MNFTIEQLSHLINIRNHVFALHNSNRSTSRDERLRVGQFIKDVDNLVNKAACDGLNQLVSGLKPYPPPQLVAQVISDVVKPSEPPKKSQEISQKIEQNETVDLVPKKPGRKPKAKTPDVNLDAPVQVVSIQENSAPLTLEEASKSGRKGAFRR